MQELQFAFAQLEQNWHPHLKYFESSEEVPVTSPLLNRLPISSRTESYVGLTESLKILSLGIKIPITPLVMPAGESWLVHCLIISFFLGTKLVFI